MADQATMVEVPGPGGPRSVRLSSPQRVIWPATDRGPAITKADLAAYVVAVGGPLLAGLADRPVTLERFPKGIDQAAFYSKNPPSGLPDYARVTPVTYPSGRSHDQLVIDEVATIVWAVQMNTLTFHPWPVRTGAPDHPDELRIDLDPQPGRTFVDVVEAACLLRTLLAELGLTGWVKTSGHRGLHIFAAISPEYEFLQVRHAVIGIGRELERRAPELITMSWWKEQRGQRVFVDFNQACRDRTLAAPYSPRPLPGAPVSFPVSWSDLPQINPADFTVLTVPGAVAADAWAGRQGPGGASASLEPALQLWQADVSERGLGELPFPPDYPKMPGEPPRVQPSRAKA